MKRASDNLVKAAQKAAFDKTEDDSVVVKTKFVGGIAQVREKSMNESCEVLDINPPDCVICPFPLNVTERLHFLPIYQNATVVFLKL